METTTDIKAGILDSIRFYLVEKHGTNAWGAHGLILRDKLDILDPGMPDDGIPGFIAFSKGKQRLKLLTNRFLTRKLQLNSGFLPDDSIRAIATDLNDDYFGTCSDVKLDKGPAITENYRLNIGGNSCMTGECADYTQLYEMNPDRFQQLIIKDGNDSARAIVSKLDDDTYFMDRIYSTCPYLADKMTGYAEQQGWLHKKNNLCGIILIVSGLVYEDDCIPYMDTLTYYRIDGDTLTISNSSNICPDGELSNTDGTLCADGGTPCENCGERVDEDDSYSDDNGYYYCQCCFDELFMYCDCCDLTQSQNGSACVNDNWICGGCLERNYTRCDDCNEYIENDNVFEVQKNECTIYVCESCLSDYVCCEDCEEYFDHKEMTETDDGYLCPDCTPVCKECSEYHSDLVDDLCPDCALEKLIEHTK